MSDIDTTQSKEYNRIINFQSVERRRYLPFAFFFIIDTIENESYNKSIYYKLLVL